MRSILDRILFMQQVPMFQHMTLAQLRELALHVETQDVQTGEVIYYEGDSGNALHIVASGQVRIVKHYGTPNERDLAILRPRDFFGEMSIFEMAPHSATVVATEATCVFVLSAEHFKQFITQHPVSAFAIARELTARIRRETLDHGI